MARRRSLRLAAALVRLRQAAPRIARFRAGHMPGRRRALLRARRGRRGAASGAPRLCADGVARLRAGGAAAEAAGAGRGRAHGSVVITADWRRCRWATAPAGCCACATAPTATAPARLTRCGRTCFSTSCSRTSCSRARARRCTSATLATHPAVARGIIRPVLDLILNRGRPSDVRAGQRELRNGRRNAGGGARV